MKVKNFPGHKNKRQTSALAMLPNKEICKEERETLLERITPQSNAEDIRTKKTRIAKEKGKKKNE